MHIGEIYDFFVRMQQSQQLPVLIMGLLAGAAIGAWVTAIVLKRSGGLVPELRDQIGKLQGKLESAQVAVEGLSKQVEGLQDERQTLQENASHLEGKIAHQRQVIAEVSQACERNKEDLLKARRAHRTERKLRKDTQSIVHDLIEQLKLINNSDGRIWLAPTAKDSAHQAKIPPFLALHHRRTAIISVANLKGGVGKTTLTANLGAALAVSGLRVLLVDLDYQSSLTTLCLDYEARGEVKRLGTFVDEFFDKGGDLAAFNRCVAKVDLDAAPGQLYLAPVQEGFADIENRLMTRWHSGLAGEDVRFRLRNALHSPRLRDHYDVVLIDCPPRLTTGSINALTASDHVLIPVLLEEKSTEAVPRMLSWLKKFQGTCCPDVNVLGVVGNKAYPRARLIGREQAAWSNLQQDSQEIWQSPVRFFDEVIREHATVQGPLAALDPRHQPRYLELVRQIRQEIPHAHLEPARIPPVDAAPAFVAKP